MTLTKCRRIFVPYFLTNKNLKMKEVIWELLTETMSFIITCIVSYFMIAPAAKLVCEHFAHKPIPPDGVHLVILTLSMIMGFIFLALKTLLERSYVVKQSSTQNPTRDADNS